MVQRNTDPISNMSEKGRTESVKTISLLGALGSWMAVAVFIFAGLEIHDPRYSTITVIAAIMAISLSLANFLANRNKVNLAIWLSVFASEITFIAISFTVANLGIVLAIVLLVIIGSLAFQTISTNATVITALTGIVASIITLAVDVFSLNSDRIIPRDWLSEITVVAGGIIILVLGILLLRYYQFSSIRIQVIIAFVTISVVPLWTVAAPQLIALSSSLQIAAQKALSSNAAEIANNFDVKLNHLKDTNTNIASLPIVIKFTQDGTGAQEDILEYFQITERSNPYILSYSLFDENGRSLVNTRSTSISVEPQATADFLNATQYQQSSISEISFDQTINKHVFYISSPILNSNNDVIGVLRAEIAADFLQIEFETAIQETSATAILIDQDGIILANTLSEETRFKSLVPLTEERLTTLQQKNILPPGTAENLSLGLSDLKKGLDQSDQNPIFQALLVPDASEINVVTQRGLANHKSWKVLIGQPASLFTETANNQTRATILIATIIMLIALGAAVITSNLLTSPIKYLTTISERIKHGELDVDVKLQRRDEIGQLGETLNTNAVELRKILATLEGRVEEQTKNLATETENINQRSNQLHSIIEITNTITPILNLNELLPEISRQISAAFGFYHVGIFLTDQAGQYTILQASNSAGGKKMLEKAYRMKIGQTGIVGFVTGSGQPRIALDVGDDPTFFNNPDLPDTRSEIALPLRNGDSIIGTLDIQSNKPSDFDTQDISVFSLLANQLAIAIQNARLFEETRAALVEAQVFYRQSATASWREVLRQGTRGYRYINGSIEAIKIAGEPPRKMVGGSNDPEILIIPINIRGKSLGVLNIRQTGRSHSWSSAEIHVYQSIVDRISFALENARLYQDAQRRASKERVISEIATKVSSSVNMDNILQTAVEELGRVLPGSEVVIQFEQEEDETGA